MKGKQRVFVGLSGGVDSAVSAALLVRAGYDVTGVFIKIWQPSFVACTWKEDRLDAMRVAVSLGIPFRTLDLSEAYEREVIARMVADYSRGITPNPDMLCNRFIKFGAFLEWARHEGADLIATGHHAQVKGVSGSCRLLRGADSGKDQAYFLAELSQEALSQTLFPIGHLTKRAVREQALKLNLPVAKRPDSQGLCFVGDVDMHDFLRTLLAPVPGQVLDTAGEVIGEHDGAALYTLGQRHAFRITGTSGIGMTPYYIVAIDTAANTITAAPNIDAACREEVIIDDCNWISGTVPPPGSYIAETRYHQKPQLVQLEALDRARARVLFEKPVLAVPGQSLVLYEADTCLGSGIILPAAASAN